MLAVSGPVFALAIVFAAVPAHASEARNTIRAFMAHCFTKGMTRAQAEKRLRQTTNTPMNAPLPLSLDFYDTTLGNGSGDNSEVKPGTDRRCRVTLEGAYAAEAEAALRVKMKEPPVFGTPRALPDSHASEPETTFIEGRELLRGRCAVVEVRQGNGTTSIGVDRIAPGGC